MDSYLPDDRPKWYETDNGRNTFVLAVCLPLSLAVWHFSSRETSALVTGSIIILYSIISLKWHLKTKVWFWLIMSFFIVAHLACAFFLKIHLPDGPAISYVLPAVVIDGGIMYGVLSLIERHMQRS